MDEPFGPGDYHLLDSDGVVLLQVLLCVLTAVVTNQVELALNALLEGLAKCHTWRWLQAVVVGIIDDLLHVLLPDRNLLRDVLRRLAVNDNVTDTDTEAVVEQPVVEHPL